MTVEDFYPCIDEEELEDHIWPRCTIMDCNRPAMHFISKDAQLCDQCYCGRYK